MPTVRQTRYTDYSKLAVSLPSIPNFAKGESNNNHYPFRKKQDIKNNASTDDLTIKNSRFEGLSAPKIDKKYLDVKNYEHSKLIGRIEKNDLFYDLKLPNLNPVPKRRRLISERKEFSVHPFPKLGSGGYIYLVKMYEALFYYLFSISWY